VSRYQKGKTNLDFTEARDSEWQWHQLGYMQVCTSIQADNHASTPQLDYVCRPISLLGHSAVVFHAFMFLMFLFYVGLLIVCVVVFYQWHFIDLFSCIAANLFNKLTYLLPICIINYVHRKILLGNVQWLALFVIAAIALWPTCHGNEQYNDCLATLQWVSGHTGHKQWRSHTSGIRGIRTTCHENT